MKKLLLLVVILWLAFFALLCPPEVLAQGIQRGGFGNHASRHAAAGADALKIEDLGTDAAGDCLFQSLGNGSATCVSGGVTATNAVEFENKTLDAEGPGNIIGVPAKQTLWAGVCRAGTAESDWTLPAAGAGSSPSATCVSGTNTTFAVLNYPATLGLESAFSEIWLPSDWVGNIDVEIKWRTASTTGNVVWQLKTACAGNGELLDQAFNTADDIIDAALATADQQNHASFSNINTTGCVAGDTMAVKLSNSETHASDTITAAPELIAAQFTVRRRMGAP